MKNTGIFEILTFENFKKTLTNDVVSFEQPGPGHQISWGFENTGIIFCICHSVPDKKGQQQ